jgi:hypothetical protein
LKIQIKSYIGGRRSAGTKGAKVPCIPEKEKRGGMYPLTAGAWTIHSPGVATKRMDLACFTSHGTHIQKELKGFFQVEDLKLEEKRPATLIFKGKMFQCYFKLQAPKNKPPSKNPRFFWSKLEQEIRKLFPQIYTFIETEKRVPPNDVRFIQFTKLKQNQTYEIDFLSPHEINLDSKLQEIGPANSNLQTIDDSDTTAAGEMLGNDPEIAEDLGPEETSEALADLFLAEADFDQMLRLLAKKNVILQGPPGVGKSYIAKRLAYALIGAKEPTKVGMIQFHQTYSYEDFIQGYRPNLDGSFQLKNGVFYDFCTTASSDSTTPVCVHH